MKNSRIILLYLFTVLFISCQSETETVVLNNENSFAKTSPIAFLVSRVSQYETTADNVLDGTSNCSIKLPAHITVDNQYVYVASESDFQTIRNIKNQSTTDDDKIHFSFPITIVYPNYQEHNVASEAEFENILAEYGDDSPYLDINCLDFNYPVSINIYNSNNQVASSVTIHNDSEHYNFLENLTDGEIVGFVFPITLTKTTGGSLVINSIIQLESTINEAIDDCNVSGPNPVDLSEILTSGSWHVSYFYSDHDETGYYNGYNLYFNTNSTCTAVKNSVVTNGDWDLHDENSYQRLDLHYDGSALEEIEEGWKVLEYTATYIRLKHESGGGSDNHYLNFTKN